VTFVRSESAVVTADKVLLLPTDGRPLPGAPCVVQDMTVQLAPGSRCLLIGPNGEGDRLHKSHPF
jgi:ABC-type uncharacterized transport system ATPase subunit